MRNLFFLAFFFFVTGNVYSAPTAFRGVCYSSETDALNAFDIGFYQTDQASNAPISLAWSVVSSPPQPTITYGVSVSGVAATYSFVLRPCSGSGMASDHDILIAGICIVVLFVGAIFGALLV